MRDGFFVKTNEKWAKVRYDEILWVRAFENGHGGRVLQDEAAMMT